MRTLLLIGGWADERFGAWALRSLGRPEGLAALGALIFLVALWRIAERNQRERRALDPRPRPVERPASQGD